MRAAVTDWDLAAVYPSLDSTEYLEDKDELVRESDAALEMLERISGDPELFSGGVLAIVRKFEGLSDLAENLGSFVYALWSSNTADEAVQREMDDIESRVLAVTNALVRFRSVLNNLTDQWTAPKSGEWASYSFWLGEQLLRGRHQMSPAEEALAADLQRSGGDAWDRLQGRLGSAISGPWGDSSKTLTELRAMAFDADREIRRSAWKEEQRLLRENEISFAAALNGVKGTAASLNERRGWGSALEKSLFQNRLTRQALDAMLGAITEYLPTLRGYFRAKAEFLGIEKLSWYDLFAPVGQPGEPWSWERTAEFIPRMFDTLSPEMGNFARESFAARRIDALPRAGKVGGAYCTYLPLRKESRILCNFDGSFDSVATVAHELGHGWHNEVMKDLGGLSRECPMTLAETASTFAETLVFRAALAEVPAEGRPAVLDAYLIGASQTTVDILSRFLFESALTRARSAGELSPRELSEMMLEAQERTYGEVLCAEERHRWMWAVKGHYYSPDFAFYNYPYAFGQLFSLSLYGKFQEEGPEFEGRFRALLRRSGSEDAVGLTRAAGFDIESPDFWRRGLQIIGGLIDLFRNCG